MHYMEPGEDVNWLPRFAGGVAEQCVLALLSRGEGTGSSFVVSSGRGDRSSPAKGRSTRCWPACGAMARSRRRGGSQTPPPPRRYYHLTREPESRPLPAQEQRQVASATLLDEILNGRTPGVTPPTIRSARPTNPVRRHLAQLDAALQGVDASRRQEILAEVQRAHRRGADGGSIPTTARVSDLSCPGSATPLSSPPRQAHRLRAAVAGTRGRHGSSSSARSRSGLG